MTSQRFFILAGVCLFAPFALAQTPANMQTISSPGGAVAQNIYPVDLNNDGVLDLVQDTLNTPNGFTVSIANGDGTFRAPVFYSVPRSPNIGGPSPIAVGDFNNDGNADVAVEVTGSNQLEVFLGKGDGTFQSPQTVSVALPSGYGFTLAPMVAADFNQDGNVDLVVVGGSGSTFVVYVLEGDGAGSFSNPQGVYTATYGPQFQHVVDGIVTGDFDGDGKPDIALTDDKVMQGSYFGTALEVLYGNGDFTFDTTTAYSVANSSSSSRLIIASGDLNGDGKTDLFGLLNSSPQELAVFYADSSRTFDSYFTGLPADYYIGSYSSPYFAQPLTPPFVMADFNGDQKMDIAVPASNYSGVVSMLYLLAGANPGEFTAQMSALPNLGSQQFWSNPVAIGKSNDDRPSLAISQASSVSASSSTITALVNTTDGYWGNCNYPKTGNGVSLCSPTSGTTNSPFSLFAAANSFGQLRKIELWVDGTKVNEQHNAWGHNAWFAWNGPFNAGTHSATFFAADIDNRLSRDDFSFTIGSGSCAAPSSPGVNVCAPANGSTVSSPVQVSAAAKIAGTLNRMEIWVDGVKEYTETISLSFSTTLNIPAGSHRFDIYAVNNAGTKYETTVFATVK